MAELVAGDSRIAVFLDRRVLPETAIIRETAFEGCLRRAIFSLGASLALPVAVHRRLIEKLQRSCAYVGACSWPCESHVRDLLPLLNCLGGNESFKEDDLEDCCCET